ncbi:MAG: regulatory iron-sulfur-containing complex subunit RicT [Candidatus Riflebacteria bacterium]|nr:regulatory iron-sulfur-containing complex subunit RicT [Candidatus Riflebacteria bacterium]
MNHFIALRLRKLPTVYWTPKPEELNIEATQDVVVTTQHGCEVARVLQVTETRPAGLKQESEPFIVEIQRIVNADDVARIAELRKKERDAFLQARDKIQHHQLPMKLLKAEFLYDYSRLILYFKSDNKVDFRDLLKSLAGIFKTRIELRQIGVRDETKLLGGIGCCGKEVCCAQFMSTFYPVSTKMAKEQNLSLNPAKLSGICGRLLCCLAHEHEYYASFHGKFPKITAEVVVGAETGRVMDINYITRKILIGFIDRRKASYDLDKVMGRKDATTGRNLWWVSIPGAEEPDLSILLKNLNPPGSGKKKKKSDGPPRKDDSERPRNNSDRRPAAEEKRSENQEDDNSDADRPEDE